VRKVHTSEKKSNFLKINEQRGNFYENKGSVFHSQPRSGNVIENKGCCALKAGILLKRKDIDCMSWVVGGGRAGAKCQVPGFRGRRSEIGITLRDQIGVMLRPTSRPVSRQNQ
jgi:hypothetical protein